MVFVLNNINNIQFLCDRLASCYVRFDFSGKTPLALVEHGEHTVDAIADGCCDAVLMWWKLEMNHYSQLVLNTAPYWAHPTPDNMQVFHCAVLGFSA